MSALHWAHAKALHDSLHGYYEWFIYIVYVYNRLCVVCLHAYFIAGITVLYILSVQVCPYITPIGRPWQPNYLCYLISVLEQLPCNPLASEAILLGSEAIH